MESRKFFSAMTTKTFIKNSLEGNLRNGNKYRVTSLKVPFVELKLYHIQNILTYSETLRINCFIVGFQQIIIYRVIFEYHSFRNSKERIELET